MKEELVSIIVPIYNVEKYLEQCVISLINQSYKNIEIILINDGSTDNSIDIMNKYKKLDGRVKCYCKVNGGLSDARNYGISVSKGKYIVFVDSDDYVEKDYISILYNLIIENNVKISQCGINKVYENKVLDIYKYDHMLLLDKYNYLSDSYSSHKIENVVVWNKMYSSDLLDDESFEKGKIHEDEFFTYKQIYNLDKIAISDLPLYNYRVNHNGITLGNFNKNRLSIIEALLERIDFYSNLNEEHLKNLTAEYAIDVMLKVYCLSKKYLNDSDILNNISMKINHIFKNNKICNKKTKVKYYLFCLNKDLYYKLVNRGGRL